MSSAGLAIEKLALYEPPFVVNDSRPTLPDGYLAHLKSLLATGRRSEAVTYFMTASVGLPGESASQLPQERAMFKASKAMAHTLVYDGMVMGDTMSERPISGEP